jgi:hypothetical protein
MYTEEHGFLPRDETLRGFEAQAYLLLLFDPFGIEIRADPCASVAKWGSSHTID